MNELSPDLLNRDFVDFLRCILEHDVESIQVGGDVVVLKRLGFVFDLNQETGQELQ